MLKAQRRDSEWRLEIFKARLEVFDKRARLEEERAADFRSLTADFFVDVLRQYERINGTSQSGASNLFDYSTVRLIDLISNLDQKRFLAMLQPSSDEYYWLEPFSEVSPSLFICRKCSIMSFCRLFNTGIQAHPRPRSD